MSAKDDLREAMRILHVVRAWAFQGSGNPNPAREDSLYPKSGCLDPDRRLRAAMERICKRIPYEPTAPSAKAGAK